MSGRFRLSAALLFLAAAPASAASVLVETFDYGPVTYLNAASSVFDGNWKTTRGTVDYLAQGDQFGNLCSGFAGCVDLDGSTQDAGVFATTQVFAEGVYSMTFQLTGNQRGGAKDKVTIRFGDLVRKITLKSGDVVSQLDFGTLFQNITVGPDGARLSFSNKGGDDFGAILKTVTLDTVAPVPLPAGGVLLAGGVALLAGLRLRRRAA